MKFLSLSDELKQSKQCTVGSGGKTFNEKEFLLGALVSFYELSQNTSEPVKVILDKKKCHQRNVKYIAILRRS